ncbi:MAG: FAD-dependent oxidoreductase [Melioribacteraceae bacterium]|nr:FAD-dependent oxidoreductase [Melioribacteraceae bacterium]MCF8264725.1 FAD-dependent oxidoreductase [Melioribacteraceae bacterium]
MKISCPDRRKFIKQMALFASMTALPKFGMPDINKIKSGEKVYVIGAGISGIAAARKLHNAGVDVTILEARNRLGGRIWTDRSLGLPVDLGASWIHGPSVENPIKKIADDISANLFETDNESLSVFDNDGNEIDDAAMSDYYNDYIELLDEIETIAEEMENDSTVKSIIQSIEPDYLTDLIMQYQLTSYMEFDSGGDINKLSAKYWANDLKYSGNDVLFPDGYDTITNYLADGLKINLEHIVNKINYQNDSIILSTDKGNFEADYLIVTLPLGVLKSGSVTFLPDLPESKKSIMNKVEMGSINKVFLSWDESFWDDDLQYIGVTTEVKGMYPYFLNANKFTPYNGLMTFGFGEYGKTMEENSDEQIKNDILNILRKIYGNDVTEPNGVIVSRWNSDEFTKGAYSFAGVGNSPEFFDGWKETIEDRIFFAGEHTINDYRGTVHGAYISGIQAADKILDAITSVKTNYNQPNKIKLMQNYPNPFNATTKIKYTIANENINNRAENYTVKLVIFDAVGREVKTLVDEQKSPGEYVIQFDGNNLSSGTYTYTLTQGDFTKSKKMILLK